MNHRKEITADTARLRCYHALNSIACDRGVDCVSTRLDDCQSGGRGEMVRRNDHRFACRADSGRQRRFPWSVLENGHAVSVGNLRFKASRTARTADSPSSPEVTLDPTANSSPVWVVATTTAIITVRIPTEADPIASRASGAALANVLSSASRVASPINR